MTEDGDRIDPTRTELTRQMSLEKAKDRRVVMTDILDRLRTYSIKWHPEDAVDLAAEAADEIEMLREQIERLRQGMQYRTNERDKFWRDWDEAEAKNVALRGIIQQAADDVVAASYPRRMHLEWLEAARKALAEDETESGDD